MTLMPILNHLCAKQPHNKDQTFSYTKIAKQIRITKFIGEFPTPKHSN